MLSQVKSPENMPPENTGTAHTLLITQSTA